MSRDYGIVYNHKKSRGISNLKSNMITDDGFNKFVQDFDHKLKINKKTKIPHESFTEKYRYYKEFLKNFKDRKERSCSRQRQSMKNFL